MLFVHLFKQPVLSASLDVVTIELALTQLLLKDRGPWPKPAVLRLLNRVYSGSMFMAVGTAVVVAEVVAVDVAMAAQFIIWVKLPVFSGATRFIDVPRVVDPELYFATSLPRLPLDKASGELKLAFYDQTLMLPTVASDGSPASKSESVKMMALVFSFSITCVLASTEYLEKTIIGLVVSDVVDRACLVLA